jgi:iron(III) transport system permease protein
MSTLPPKATELMAAPQVQAARKPFWRTEVPLLTGMKLVWLLLLTIGMLLPVAMMLLQAAGLVASVHSSEQHGMALIAQVVQGPISSAW